MRTELVRISHSAQVSCSGLSASIHSREGGAAVALEREKALRVQLEQQLRDRVSEMMNLQTRTDTERSELNLRSVPMWSFMDKSLPEEHLPGPLSVYICGLISFFAGCVCVNCQVVRFSTRNGETEEPNRRERH